MLTANTTPLGRNYLRVRGEYWIVAEVLFWKMELPPRARRILADRGHRIPNLGTTSACAENTTKRSGHPIKAGNYLRVRGEYSMAISLPKKFMELPPRARRIPALELQI